MALRVLHRYLDGLLALDRDRLCERQAELAAGAIRSLLATALIPPGSEQGLGSRRRVMVRDRIVAHVDVTIADACLSAESIGAALGCSRSALYRATAGLGG